MDKTEKAKYETEGKVKLERNKKMRIVMMIMNFRMMKMTKMLGQ
jgi:hypothetical protein